MEDEFSDAPASTAVPGFLTDPKGVLARRGRWMAVAAVAFAVVAATVISFLPQSYEASARLLFSSQRIPEEFVRSTLSESVDEQVNAMIGEVLSRESLDQVASTHGMARPGEPVSAEMLWDLREAIEIAPERLVTADRREPSYIYRVTVTWGDPEVAAAITNDFIGRFITAHGERRARQVRLATEFLRRGREEAETALRAQSAQITEFKERHRGELPAELSTKLASLERLQQQRQSLALQISDAEGRLLIVRSASGGPGSRATLLADLRTRLVKEESIYTPEHPAIVSLRRQIAELEAAPPEPVERAAGADPAAAAVERELATLRSQLAEIDLEMKRLDSEAAQIPARQEELEAMLGREEVLREAFTEASRKLQEAELAQNLEQAQQGIRLSRLEEAVPPDSPKYPKPLLLLGALLGSLVFGAAMGVLLELFDPVVLTRADLEAATGLPILGIVPRAR